MEAMVSRDRNAVLSALGERIRTLRLGLGYSQEAFAAICGLDRSYLGAVERGERNISILKASHIASKLDITVSELLSEIV